VEYKISDTAELKRLIDHLTKTTANIEGIKLNNIYFPKYKKEFVLFLECQEEKTYLDWRKICPPPDGANDWYEVFLNKEEKFE
jgi:hypothetical protein